MRIRNKKNMANYVNYKISGFPKKTIIPAGSTVELPEITDFHQITNSGDFQRGFFEIIAGEPEKIETKKTSEKKKEDSLDKVKKEVKDYTEKDNKNKKSN